MTSESDNNCFFCGDILFKSEPSGESFSKSAQNYRNKNKTKIINEHKSFKMWDDNCALSLCQVLQIPPRDPSVSILFQLQYQSQLCSNCHELIRSLDFTLRSLTKLHKEVLHCRSKLYRKLVQKSNDQSPAPTTDTKNRFLKQFHQLFEKIVETRPNWNEFDFLPEDEFSDSDSSVQLESNENENSEETDTTQLNIKNEPTDLHEDFLSDDNYDNHLFPKITIDSLTGNNGNANDDFVSDEIEDTNFNDEDDSMNSDWSDNNNNNDSTSSISISSYSSDDEDEDFQPYKNKPKLSSSPSRKSSRINPTDSKLKPLKIESVSSLSVNQKPERAKYSTTITREIRVLKPTPNKRVESVPCVIEGCDGVFKLIKDYEAHFNQKHSDQGIKPYKCKTCSKPFPKYNALTRHEDLHLIDEHKRTHTACSFCGAWKLNGNELESHETLHRLKPHPFSCLLCEDSPDQTPYLHVGQLNRHMKEFHPEHCGEIAYLYKCLKCNKIFIYRHKLTEHLQEIHGIEPNKCVCEICGKTYEVQGLLDLHKRKVHIDKSKRPSVMCEICGKSFFNTEYFTTHKKLHGIEGRSFKCGPCGRTYKTLKGLRKHEVTHSGLEFKCDVCSKVFKTQQYLNRHAKRHLKPKGKKRKNKKKDKNTNKD